MHIMKEKPFSYYQNRVREKIIDCEGYGFGKRKDGRLSKAEVLNILQELIRESDEKEEIDCFSRVILSKLCGYESSIYYLEEEKDLKNNVCYSSFWDLQHRKKLPEEIKETIIDEQTIIPEKDNIEAFFPIKGKRTIKQEIKYPSNDKDIIGALEVRNPRPFDDESMLFLEKYCRRLGMGLHHYYLLAYNKILNQHIVDMITVASHDIRGPLNSMAVGLKVLEKELYGKLGPNVKEAIKNLYKKAINLSLTLERYLGETSLFSGYIEIRKENLDYRIDIIDPLLEEFSDAFAGNHITIDESMGGIPEGTIIISADRIWLQSVYRNLFSNVLKYGGPWCTMAFGFEDWEDHYRFNVFNTGRPLDSSEQKKLFQKFSRIEGETSKNIKGSGLGLYFAKEIIERHGGKIWYEPKPDGSNFVFTLPKD